MEIDRSNVTEQREDVSRFVVHLTRDDRDDFPNGASARDNFLSILRKCRIRGFRAHCLHGKKVAGLDKTIRNAFRVACFTEAPLSQLRFLVRPIKGRQIKFSKYGFVFEKQFLIMKGAQPALYINSYGGNAQLRESVDKIFDVAVNGKFHGKIWRLLPFVNAMHEKYDFTWEREWRVVGSFKFTSDDLVCVILPPDGDDDIRNVLLKAGIAAISPDWTYERIVAELARQQRKTKLVLKGLAAKAAKDKGEEK